MGIVDEHITEIEIERAIIVLQRQLNEDFKRALRRFDRAAIVSNIQFRLKIVEKTKTEKTVIQCYLPYSSISPFVKRAIKAGRWDGIDVSAVDYDLKRAVKKQKRWQIVEDKLDLQGGCFPLRLFKADRWTLERVLSDNHISVPKSWEFAVGENPNTRASSEFNPIDDSIGGSEGQKFSEPEIAAGRTGLNKDQQSAFRKLVIINEKFPTTEEVLDLMVENEGFCVISYLNGKIK